MTDGLTALILRPHIHPICLRRERTMSITTHPDAAVIDSSEFSGTAQQPRVVSVAVGRLELIRVTCGTLDKDFTRAVTALIPQIAALRGFRPDESDSRVVRLPRSRHYDLTFEAHCGAELVEFPDPQRPLALPRAKLYLVEATWYLHTTIVLPSSMDNRHYVVEDAAAALAKSRGLGVHTGTGQVIALPSLESNVWCVMASGHASYPAPKG